MRTEILTKITPEGVERVLRLEAVPPVDDARSASWSFGSAAPVFGAAFASADIVGLDEVALGLCFGSERASVVARSGRGVLLLPAAARALTTHAPATLFSDRVRAPRGAFVAEEFEKRVVTALARGLGVGLVPVERTACGTTWVLSDAATVRDRSSGSRTAVRCDFRHGAVGTHGLPRGTEAAVSWRPRAAGPARGASGRHDHDVGGRPRVAHREAHG